MSEARKHIGELLAFFQKSGRRCMVIWERTHEEHERPELEVGINPDMATVDFFRSSALVLNKIAEDIDDGSGLHWEIQD